MDIPLRLLIIEDSKSDVALEVRQLEAGGYRVTYEVAETAAEMKAALIKQSFDIVISDHSLPQFDATGALAMLKQSGLDIPFIIVSGAIGEETAVALMKAGAHDYVMKDKLSRLCPAIARELKDAEVRARRKQAESARLTSLKALLESQERYKALFDCSLNLIYVMNFDGKFIDANKAALDLLGYKREEIRSVNVNSLVDEDQLPLVLETIREIIKTGIQTDLHEIRLRNKDGREIYVEAQGSIVMSKGKPVAIQVIARDITEHKRADELLKKSESKYRLLADNIHDVIFVMDMDLKYSYLSPSVKLLRGYEPEEAMKQTPAQTVTPSSLNLALGILSEIMELEKSEHRDINVSRTFQVEMSRKDGTTVWTEVKASLIRDQNQRAIGIMGVTRDITDRKRMEDTLRQSEERYRTILEDIQEGYFEVDFAGNFTFFNNSLCQFLGYTKEELMGMNNRQYTDKENARKIFQTFNKVYNTGKSTEGFNWQLVRKDGTKRYVEVSISLKKDSSGRPMGFRGVARDVTERKNAEEDLKASERKYRLLADNIQDVIFVLDMNLKYTYISPSVKTMRGYEPEEVLKQSIDETLTPSSHNLVMKTFSEIMELEKSGLREEIPLSLTMQLEMKRKDGTTLWTDVKFSFIRDENQRPIAIMGVTRDITEQKKSEEELQKTLESLRKSFGATIQVMVSAVEARDPYTAGHQLRVADLARAIATEMELDQEKIEGIRMAGSIHDVGKLSIPAELLSKPTKLTDIEFSLIKEHPRIGYEMMKDVESPWPLAQIVYQHHERMNGSGYPRNLKGDEIIMEARIIAVADVVEAMASYRPYRPALGIDAALAEIEKNKGIFYDDAVADACLRLFREKGYRFT
ncbi:MAG: PAS domain S-box protein [Smithella sp.]